MAEAAKPGNRRSRRCTIAQPTATLHRSGSVVRGVVDRHGSSPIDPLRPQWRRWIAYQVLGSGPLDVLMVPGFPSHVELAWEYPRLAYFFRHLASVCRLIVMDKRGIGLSDRVPPSQLPGMGQRALDVRAVLDDVGSDRVALVGASDGGPVAAIFAATHPERTDRLVLINTYARRIRSDDYPWGPGVRGLTRDFSDS